MMHGLFQFCHRSPETAEHHLRHGSTLPFKRTFMWSGDTKLFLASIKSIENELNVERDTGLAGIRSMIFV